MKVAVALVTLVLLVVAGIAAVRLLLGAVGLIHGRDESTHDPMFADEVERFTRPPELAGDEGDYDSVDWLEDRSENWEEGEETPVDKTASELAVEESVGATQP